MAAKLYHSSLFLPSVRYPSGILPLVWTRHAIQASLTDRYGRIAKLDYLNCNSGKIIEVEVNNGEVTKILYRFPHCDKYSILLAVKPENNCLVVKTVWLNSKDDNHTTLNSGVYERSL